MNKENFSKINKQADLVTVGQTINLKSGIPVDNLVCYLSTQPIRITSYNYFYYLTQQDINDISDKNKRKFTKKYCQTPVQPQKSGPSIKD